MVADRLIPAQHDLSAGDLRSMPASEWSDQLVEVVVQPSWCVDIIVPGSEVRVGIRCSGAGALTLWNAP